MDLSAYLNFSIVLDYATQQLRLTDTSNYPAGVRELITGSVSIKQPDQLTTTGSFSDVSFDGSALTVAIKELRLSTTSKPQNGTYYVTYTVRAAGYDDTTLAKQFTLNYTRPTLVITKAFDLFTPNLRVIDSSIYAQSAVIQSVAREWTATVGNLGEIGSTGQVFNLAKDGYYYDASYQINLTSTVEYDVASWVKLFDTPTASVTYTANTPPTLADLREDLTLLKSRIECGDDSDYISASAIFENLKDKGKNQDLDGLDEYVLELQKIFNNNITPSYTNTNEVIPAYDWGSSGGGVVEWNDVINKPSIPDIFFKVGDAGFPAAGSNTYTNAQIAGKKVIVNRGYFPQPPANPGDGNQYYEKLLSSNTISFYPALGANEVIHIIVLGL